MRRVDLVGDDELRVALVVGGRDADDPLGCRHLHDTGRCPPPVVAAIEDDLVGRGPHHLPGAGADRPALLDIEEGEVGLVLDLGPDVLGQPDQPVAEIVGELAVDVARIGLDQVDLHGERVDDGGTGDLVGDLDRLPQVFLVLAVLEQHVEGVGDVLGVERLAVAPGDAVAQRHGDAGEVVVVGVALGDPGNVLAGEVVVGEERLVDEHDAVTELGTQRVPVAVVGRAQGRRAGAPADGDQCPLARNLGQILCSSCSCRQQARRQCRGACP